jgi:hypothetical protein
VSEGRTYNLDLEFFKAVSQEGSVWKVLPRNIHMVIKKGATNEDFWPRLLKDKRLEKTNVKIDWDKYVEEDEEDDFGFDMSALDGGMVCSYHPNILHKVLTAHATLQDFGNMGGGGDYGPPGEDEPDSDDEEDLPDLEEQEDERKEAKESAMELEGSS